MTRLIHLDRIHSFRFFSSCVSNEDTSSEPQITSTGNDFLMQETQEFKDSRFYDDVFRLEVFDDVVSAGLWIVFLVLDALLLVYRFTTMYSNGLIICRHFNRSSSSSSHRILSNSDSAMSSVERTLAATADAKRPEEYTAPDFASPVACETSSDAPHSRTDCSKPLQSYRLICACSREGLEVTQSSDAVSSAPRWSPVQSNSEAAKLIAIQILQSSTFLKFIIAGIVLLLSFVAVRAAGVFLDVRVFIAWDCFNVCVDAIRTQMNDSDWSLLEEAQHLNQLAISFYRNHVQSELANLQVLLEYFNSGTCTFI